MSEQNLHVCRANQSESRSCSVLSRVATPWTVPARLLCPWDSPGKKPGVGAMPFSRDLPDTGIKPQSPALEADCLPSEPPGTQPSTDLNFPTGNPQWVEFPEIKPRDMEGGYCLPSSLPTVNHVRRVRPRNRTQAFPPQRWHP